MKSHEDFEIFSTAKYFATVNIINKAANAQLRKGEIFEAKIRSSADVFLRSSHKF